MGKIAQSGHPDSKYRERVCQTFLSSHSSRFDAAPIFQKKKKHFFCFVDNACNALGKKNR
jgi:hypothetical protein